LLWIACCYGLLVGLLTYGLLRFFSNPVVKQVRTATSRLDWELAHNQLYTDYDVRATLWEYSSRDTTFSLGSGL